ncbi:MAG: hypothetical protein MR607_03170 [Lachnospiraceae bacterium]|nr:hypothetical protein [Lachnospiraceae bacterium]
MSTQLAIDTKKPLHDVSPTLYGIFLEDINYSCDGGLNANMVANYSFDDRYIRPTGTHMAAATLLIMANLKKRFERTPDRLRHWCCKGGTMESRTDGIDEDRGWYARITFSGSCRLENLGYNGSRKNKGRCAMGIRQKDSYVFSCLARCAGDATLCVYSASEDGQALTEKISIKPGKDWRHLSATVLAMRTGYGKLVIEIEADSYVDLDSVSFMNADTWGKDDPKWTQGKLRRDMVEVLRDLRPGFVRFPGGCLVEGIDPGNEYHWKDSIGSLEDRRQEYNLWASRSPNGDYMQSRQIGFYEFFLLCEDLGAEPLPVVWAGMNCQMRRRGKIDLNSDAFQKDVVQNALDLLEYANGDPITSEWAAKRAEAGHPEPFHVKYLGIGNENYGEDYLARFDKVRKAVLAEYPEIICIMSSGSEPAGKNFDTSIRHAATLDGKVYVDEHFYKSPTWTEERVTRYDNLPRNNIGVFLGEWAAARPTGSNCVNSFESALAEAAFLTGVERNADKVKMTCYAPLFSMVGGNQWVQNLIEFNPLHVMKTSNYFVQQMFGATVGKQSFAVQGTLPEKFYACATGDEKTLTVKLVNTSRDSRDVSLSLDALTPEMAELTVLQSDVLKVRNNLSFDGSPEYRVKPEKKTVRFVDGKLELHLDKQSVNVIQIVL